MHTRHCVHGCSNGAELAGSKEKEEEERKKEKKEKKEKKKEEERKAKRRRRKEKKARTDLHGLLTSSKILLWRGSGGFKVLKYCSASVVFSSPAEAR